jgi:predicted DNA-binding transcriptional regulator AlpA
MIGADLPVFMEKQGLNLSELARMLGISRARLRKMIGNQSKVPAYVGLSCSAIAWGLPGWSQGLERAKPVAVPESVVTDGGALIIGGGS